ncbi:hypothetical protein FoTM2_007400 [Fusarium oxysporum f. sp. vasinfectum]|nr:hypothetical protein FoTM2_007400 [Fusarium oxysporum f. sp. vasinfectum]
MTSNRFRLISTPLSLALAFHFMDTSKELLRVKNILDPDEVGISTSRWAPGNSPSSSSKPAEPAVEVKDNESGEDSRRSYRYHPARSFRRQLLPSSGSTRLPARITSTPPPSPLLPSLRLSITQHVRLDAKVGQSGAGLTAKPAGPTQPIYEHVLKPTSESAELKPGFEAAVKENLSGFSSSEHAAPKDSSSSPVGPILTDSPVAEPAGPTEPTSHIVGNPRVAPVLAFYYVKLHLIAKDRIICDAAKGKCIYFFGSCGAIDREIPTKGINLGDVIKARCAECTPRKHQVGNGLGAQQILASNLPSSTCLLPVLQSV